MPCPLWGDGSKWGDGDLWCRQYGGTPFVAVLDALYGRVSLRVAQATNADFYIDTLELMGTTRKMKGYRYQAVMDANTGERVSVHISHTSNDVFYIDSLRLSAQIRRQRLNG